MGSCFKKKNKNVSVKKKKSGSVTAKSSGYYPELTTSAGPESDKRTAKEKFDANPARQAFIRARERRKKRRSRVTNDDIITNDDTTNTNTTTTIIGEGIGDTSVTPESIYTQDPNDAMEAQELLAQDELRRQRIKRARAKQSLLRKRIERNREVGSGRRVLSGTERELNVQTRQAGTGRRGGTGRRSLITGSTGGIGYYSRFL
tara:strand:+ start:930 stop:1538 length:609 start_codon:yes stop_codon:yes gene_type:complete